MLSNDFYVPENLLRTEEKLSPSKKFKLTIEYYKTGPSSWNYTKGIVTKIDSNKIIAEIPRNYSDFSHTFFLKNNQEYLQTGKTYMSQTFVNLDTEEIFDNTEILKSDPQYKNGHSFCWVSSYISLDGNTLAAFGCYWACPYEYRFYDFTDPSVGWPELKCDTSVYKDGELDPHWILSGQQNLFLCYDSKECVQTGSSFTNIDDVNFEDLSDDDSKYIYIPQKIYVLLRRENSMVLISELKTEEKRTEDIEREEYWRKDKEAKADLIAKSDIYKKLIDAVSNTGNLNSSPMIMGASASLKFYIGIGTESNPDKNVNIQWGVTDGQIELGFWKKGGEKLPNELFDRSVESVDLIMDKIKIFLQNSY